jgi:hypothetical protein
MGTQESTPNIREVVRFTANTINARMSYFKKLIISIVVIILASATWSVIQISWQPLLGLVLLVPLCGIFLCLDTYLIGRWQHQILGMWTQGSLNLGIFFDTMAKIRTLPLHTLNGMLATIPTVDDLLIENDISLDIRNALLATLQIINHCQIDRIIFATIACALGLGSLAFAVILWSWFPLPGLLSVIATVIIGRWLSFFRFRRLMQQISTINLQDADIKTFVNLAAQLEWGSITDKQKDGFFDSLGK